jgi:rod shape determining protein RodA
MRYVARIRDFQLGDPVLFALVVGLSIFGVAKVHSAGVLDVPSTIVPGLWRMQLLWFVISLALMPIILRTPERFMEFSAAPIYAVAMILLLLTPIIGTGAGTAEGVPRWLAIGPLRLQTAEFAKIPVIFMLARVLSARTEAPATLWQMWKPIAVVLLPMALVMLQPDIGTSIVFAFILLATLFWVGTPVRTLFFLMSPVIGLLLAFHTLAWGVWTLLLLGLLLAWRTRVLEGAAVMGANVLMGTVAIPIWESLADYQKNRILVFMDPMIDPRGAGYNLIQSRVAIGSGGMWGKGYAQGTQKRLAFLPEQHTDFIFAVVGEEWGFLGVAAVLITFGLIFWRLVRIAATTRSAFGSIVGFGLFASWFVHVVVNTGMTVGIMPITGIPLPFVSYGGSFLLVNLLAMAIVQRIALEAKPG